MMLMTAVLMATAQQQLAFPGAEGYGKYVTGGRGGKVYYVTRTDDCPDNNLVRGTLRWALRSGGNEPRTVLFNTCGTIYLTSKLKMNHPNVSILGQSAPGGGVCLAGYPLCITADNVIIRYLRFRAGDVPNVSMTGLDMENCRQVILDHCSMTWSMEECLTAYDTDSTTVQWCIIGEGLYNSKNSKGARAYATQWGGEHSTMHHSLITNSHSRSPRFNGVRSQSNPDGHDLKVESEFVNNVVFNWSNYNAIYGGENASTRSDAYNRVFMVNNYYRPGPATRQNTASRRYFVSASGGNINEVGQWYLKGNKFETDSKFAPSTTIWSTSELAKVNADNYYGFAVNNASRAMNFWSISPSESLAAKALLTTTDYKLTVSTGETADEAFAKVTAQAGASLPRYDEVDRRLLDEAAGRRDPQYAGPSLPNEPGIIDSPDDILLTEHDTFTAAGVAQTNYPYLGMRDGDRWAVDTDGDGLPDSYETEVGLNPSDGTDAARTAANGYTYLENYLNGLADGTISKSRYETSDVQAVPAAPETVTVSFALGGTAGVSGTLPAPLTVKYGAVITLPAADGTLTKDGYVMAGWAAGGNTYLPGAQLTVTEDTEFTVVFNLDPTSHTGQIDHPDDAYHMPQLADGRLYELVYMPDSAFIANTVWAEVEGGDPRFNYRTGLDPAVDDGKTEVAQHGVTVNRSTRVLCLYLTGTATLRAFVQGSNSQGGDRVVMTAMPADGSPTQQVISDNKLARNGTTVATRSEVLWLDLNPLKRYKVTFMSETDLDMQVSAVKLYPQEYVDPADADKLPLTTLVRPEAGGSVQRSPNGKRYLPGTEVQLTAVPASGYLFLNWTDAEGNVISEQTVIRHQVTAATTMTAHFQPFSDFAYIFDNPVYDAEVSTVRELLVALGVAKKQMKRYRIFLHRGTYDLGTTVMTEVPANVSLIGESMDATVVVNSPDPATLTSDNRSDATPTLYLAGNDTYLQDLTVKQAIDYGKGQITGQAQAIRARGDRQVYKRVKLLGCQDTYYINKSTIRQYLEDCFIAGDVDFIYGDGTAFLNGCTIWYNNTTGGGYITAPNTPADNPWGIVISHSTIDGPAAANGNFYLGRPWNDSPSANFIGNTFNILPAAAGWAAMTSRKVLRFHEYGSVDASGRLLDLSDRSTAACYPARGSDEPVITADQAAQYTLANVLGGADQWAPQSLTAQLPPPVPVADGNRLTWAPVAGALGYAVCQDGVVVGFTREPVYSQWQSTLAHPVTVRTANAMGGLGDESVPVFTDGIQELLCTGHEADVPLYDLQGRRMQAPRQRGVYIRQHHKLIVK